MVGCEFVKSIFSRCSLLGKDNSLSIVFWTAILTGIVVGSFYEAQWKGDSTEYILYTHALATHQSADFRGEDISYVMDIMKQGDPEFLEIAPTIGKGEEFGKKSQYDGKGYLTASNGQIYSWHFWLYPLLVTPFFKLTQWMGSSPINSFIMCNWMFVFLALGYLASRWKGTFWQKQILAGLFLSSGTTYYIWWPHPEIFTASLLLLSLMSFTDRRYILSMFCTALAATQNPPLLFLQAAIAGKVLIDSDILKTDLASIKKNIKINYPILLATAGLFLIALSPVIFFEYTLGISNPIIASGSSDAKLISWSRLYSLFFDLNQGMVVSIPGIFIGVFLSFLIAMFFRERIGLAGILPLLIGISISAIMAIPSLSTTNWNHGQSVFSRYAYWLSIPISFGLTLSLRSLSRRFIFLITGIVIICQIMTILYYGVWGKNWRSETNKFKPLANYVLLNHPSLYNPVPDIFINRLPHNENTNNSNIGQRIYKYPNEDKPTKILVQADKIRETEQYLQRQCNNISKVPMEKSWIYLNVDCNESNNQ